MLCSSSSFVFFFSPPIWNKCQGGPFIGQGVFWRKELAGEWSGVAGAKMGWRAPLPLASARDLRWAPALSNRLSPQRSKLAPRVGFRQDKCRSNVLSHVGKPQFVWQHLLAIGSNQCNFGSLRWTHGGVTRIGYVACHAAGGARQVGPVSATLAWRPPP